MKGGIKIQCPNCGAWIYIVDKGDLESKKSEKRENLSVNIINVEKIKPELWYRPEFDDKKASLEKVIETLKVTAEINGRLYEFKMRWLKKDNEEWIGGLTSRNSFNKTRAKDICADENNEIFIKQGWFTTDGKNRRKITIEKMKEIAEKLGFRFTIDKGIAKIYLGEKYSEYPPLSKRESLMKKMIKVWIAFWEPNVI